MTSATKLFQSDPVNNVPELVSEQNHINTNIPADFQEFINNIKRKNLLPFPDIKVYFHDDKWDLSGITNANLSTASFIFDFTKVNYLYREDLKVFILYSCLTDRIGINATKAHFVTLCDFFNYAVSNNIYALSDFDSNVISSYFKTKNKSSERYKNSMKTHIENFFLYYNVHFENIFGNAIFEVLSSVTSFSVVSAEAIDAKSKDIPTDYYNHFLSASIKLMNNENEPTFYRGMAAMMIIESQIALRTGELFALEINTLEEIPIYTGEKVFLLTYKTWKNHRGTNAVTTAKTYVNQLTHKAYEFLVQLYKEKRENLNVSYLYLGIKPHARTEPIFPVSPSQANAYIKNYFKYLNKYFRTIYNEPADKNAALHRVRISYKNKNTKYLEYPTIAQFRVHMCTELYYKGVPLEYIELFMSHLSSTMMGYYCRPKNDPQENMDLALNILEKIVTKKALPIGATKDLPAKIDAWIKENNYNIKADLKQICRELAEKIPIRAKLGGYCIKSSQFRECSNDAETNEFYCAYGVCPNIFTFFFNVDVSYTKAKELHDLIQINIAQGHTKQAQKHKNMLKTIIESRLLPELEQLKARIEQDGVDTILEEYPQLTEILINLEKTEKEIQLWKKESEEK